MLAGYAYYQDCGIENPTSPSTALTDYSLPFRVSALKTHLLASTLGNDIRITSADGNDTLYDYEIKSIVENGDHYDLFIYVLCPSIPAGEGDVLTLRVYYGNADATDGGDAAAVAGDAVLFMPLGGSGGVLDYSDWAASGATIDNGGLTAGSGTFGQAAVAYHNYISITLPESISTEILSIELWVTLTSHSEGYQTVFTVGTPSSAWLLYEWPGAHIWSFSRWGGEYCHGLSEIQLGVPYHILAMLDGDGSHLYVNGVLQDDDAVGVFSTADIRIAGFSGINIFDGTVADYCLSTTTKSLADAQADYAYGLDGTYLSEIALAATSSEVSHASTTANLSCAATGGTYPYTYQWYRDTAINGAPTGGTWTITYNGSETTGIPWNCTPTDVNNALLTLPGNDEYAIVGALETGNWPTLGGYYQLVFAIGLGNVAEITVTSYLTGGHDVALTVSTIVEGVVGEVEEQQRVTLTFTPDPANALAGETSATLEDTGLSPETDYYYVCSVIDANDTTIWSNEVTVTTDAGGVALFRPQVGSRLIRAGRRQNRFIHAGA